MAKVLAYALVLLIVQNSIGTVDARKLEQTVFTAEDLYEMFGPNGCLEGVLVSMSAGPTPVVSAQGGGVSVTLKQQQTATSVPSGAASATGTNDPVVEVANVTTTVRPENTTSGSSAQPAATLANTKEKTPMCLVNELARYNKIQHQYRLTSEQGPAHKKRFTVMLKLGDEEYVSEGASIKKAQHSAAAEALQSTQYKHPPLKTTRGGVRGSSEKTGSNGRSGGGGNITPTVELNALAMKRGEPAVYYVQPIVDTTNASQQQQNQSHVQPPHFVQIPPPQAAQLNGAGGFNNFHHHHQHHNQHHRPANMYQQQQNRFHQYDRRGNLMRNYHGAENRRYWKQHSSYGHVGPGEVCTVILKVGSREFMGSGNTPQAARHDAASKALEELKNLPMPDGTCPAVQGDNGTIVVEDDPNSELKSPISLVHEIALKRSLPVHFAVSSEKGPPHMKVFVTICKVGDLQTEGEGNGKKVSKKRAAEKMLEELHKLGPMYTKQNCGASANCVARIKRKPSATKKKSRNLIKEKSAEPEFSEEVNPISRLIQIQQAKKEKEPVYTLVEERGASRKREFVMEVSAGGHKATGTGPNKKHAKRVAAENLLSLMGLVTPVKSSIKSADDNQAPPEKPRKVTFRENLDVVSPPSSSTSNQQHHSQHHSNQQNIQSTGGSAGRQLVPGLLLMQDQNSQNFANTQKTGVNIQTTATIAKEFLNAGNSPTADALAKAGHNGQKFAGEQHVSGGMAQSVLRPKDQLLYLAQLLGFQVQFSDFPKGNHVEFLSLVSLSTSPPQVCHGAGVSTDASHDQAALTALQMLSEMGIDNITPKKDLSSTNPPVVGSSTAGTSPGGDASNVVDTIHISQNSVANNKITKATILGNGLKK
uniref:Putative staufen n=1 Tax=Xenopsylla cheopis TaxID=163159 RepID=A0A6M2DZ61_XENCH